MAKQWDSLIKLLAEANKQDLVNFLLPGAKFEKELNSEMQSRVLEADLLYLVTLEGMQVILHVEFQKRRDGDMGKRLWKYNAQSIIIYDLPVYSFVVYLRQDGNVVKSPMAFTFATLVFQNEKDRDWLKRRFAMLSGDILEESWGYQELTARAQQKGFEMGLHEGELHALRGLIVDIAQRRFPTLVTLISNRIQQVDDTSQLRSLSVELSTAQTVQEAEQAFRALVKDAQQH